MAIVRRSAPTGVVFTGIPCTARLLEINPYGRARDRKVRITPYITESGRIGVDCRRPDSSRVDTYIESSHSLGYSGNWQVCQIFALPELGRLQMQTDYRGQHTIDCLVCAARSWRVLSDCHEDMRGHLRVSLGVGDGVLDNALSVMLKEVPGEVWCYLWDRLSGSGPEYLKDLASEYTAEYRAGRVRVLDPDMLRRMKACKLLPSGWDDPGPDPDKIAATPLAPVAAS